MMSSGVISVRIGMLPEMKTTDPYSPSARANESAKPVISGGSSSGKRTRVMVCQRLAPRGAGGFSISGFRSHHTRWQGGPTKGKPIKVRAKNTPDFGKKDFI